MTESSAFRSKEEELHLLRQEIAETRESLRAMSAAVGRIERHVMRSFDVPTKPRQSPAPRKRAKPKPLPQSTLTPEAAMSAFDGLTEVYKQESPRKADEQMRAMSVPDLTAIARQLAIIIPSRPSKKALCEGIARRLTERIMLSKNVNITPPRKAQMNGGG